MPLEQARAVHDARLHALRAELATALAGHPRVTLEIGCGHGHFLTAYARAHPGEFCLGVDILLDRLARAGKKTRLAGLNNVAWVRAEAGLLLEALPAGVRFASAIFILFPDPWPKRRHWKNRLLQAGFLTALGARAEPGTRLCFRTDHAPYFAEALAVLADHPDWRLDSATPWPFEQPTVFQAKAAGYQSLVAVRR